jgi:hypothetical protein
MRRRTAQDQKLADDAYLLRAWRRWHREELEAALAGEHRCVLERLMAQLKDLRSARQLIAAISTEDWSVVDADTRATALHQIDTAIIARREQQQLPPFDDPLPGAPPNAFQIIREIITSFPLDRGEADRSIPVNSGVDK